MVTNGYVSSNACVCSVIAGAATAWLHTLICPMYIRMYVHMCVSTYFTFVVRFCMEISEGCFLNAEAYALM